MSASKTAFTFNQSDFEEIMSNSRQAKYIYRYLRELGAKTCVIENDYVDRGFLIDYQKFYSRSFEDIERFTKRVHFFSNVFSDIQFKKMLRNNDIDDIEKLNESYLGFAIARPIKDSDGNTLIGRTMLKTYPAVTDGLKRFYVTVNHSVSLFGIELNIESIPFQAQDQGVSACATIALWTALQSLTRTFGIPERAAAEITEMATEFPSQSRIFPQSGLNLSQMVACIRSNADLDCEIINAEDNEVITTLVKAFTHAGIPIIGALKLSKDDEEDYHAVVIDGYQHDNAGKITELYVHDDQIGPFSKVKPQERTFQIWGNEWNDFGYRVELERVLIPVYHKIRLPFISIYHHYVSKKRDVERGDITMELYLSTVQKYKSFLLAKQINDKSNKLQMNLPRFIWIERAFEKGKREPLHDDVFDGTAIHCKKWASVDYE